LGGTIPQKDIEKLQEMGVAHVFQPGDGIQEIIASVRETALGTKVHHKGSDSVPSS
jgi:methylmalonyl-CoA mutase cobalamin-binding domain/chain